MKKVKNLTPTNEPQPVMTMEETIKYRLVQRVLEVVETTNSIEQAAHGLRMSVEDVQAIVDNN